MSNEANNDQSLCLSCGFCCDGTIFEKVRLKENDPHPPLMAVGIQIQRNKERTFFKQGCAGFQAGSCQVYEDRPTICRSFRCDLLVSHEAGAISRKDALAKIEKLKTLRNQLPTEIARLVPGKSEASFPEIWRIVPTQEEIMGDPLLQKRWAATLMICSAMADCINKDYWDLEKHAESKMREKRSRS